MAKEKRHIQEGYHPEKRGYQPTLGNLDTSNPPQGGSGVQPANESSSECVTDESNAASLQNSNDNE